MKLDKKIIYFLLIVFVVLVFIAVNKEKQTENFYFADTEKYGNFTGFESKVVLENLENASSFSFSSSFLWIGDELGNLWRYDENNFSNKVLVKENLGSIADIFVYGKQLFVLNESSVQAYAFNSIGEITREEVLIENLPNGKYKSNQLYYLPLEDRLFVTVGRVTDNSQGEYEGALLAYTLGERTLEVWSNGFLNPTGLAIHPATGETLVIDSTSKSKQDAPEELNIILKGLHYGAPICLGLQEEDKCPESVLPHLIFPQDMELAAMNFYNGNLFPPEFKNNLFVVSTGRGRDVSPSILAVEMVSISGGFESHTKLFAAGLKHPVEIEMGRDEALYVLDTEVGLLKILPVFSK